MVIFALATWNEGCSRDTVWISSTARENGAVIINKKMAAKQVKDCIFMVIHQDEACRN